MHVCKPRKYSKIFTTVESRWFIIGLSITGTSLTVQWLKLQLPVQWGVWVRFPDLGVKIPRALQPKNQSIQQRKCNKFNKELENCFCSVNKSCPIFCDPMDCSMAWFKNGPPQEKKF